MAIASILRNIGVIAHIDAGKTTLTERLLRRTGGIRYCGEVHEGTTVTDWLSQEREHGISIISAAVACNWRDIHINVVDTPGHVDFTAEVERVLRVLDGVVAVFCGIHGVQAQSETVWRQARRHEVSVIAFVNKLDRPGADFERVVHEIENRYRLPVVPLQVPLYEGGTFVGMIDILNGRVVEHEENETEYLDDIRVMEAREHLIECLAETDDDVLSDFLNDREPDESVLRNALRRAVLKRQVLPVFGGSAGMDIGTAALLDAVRDYLPSPEETQQCKLAGTGMLVFKVCLAEEYGEPLVCARLYGGELRSGDKLKNLRTGQAFELGSIYEMHASILEPLEEASSGDIVALGGLAGDIRTGDTLCGPGSETCLESIVFPEPVVSVTMEARGGTDSVKLGEVLRSLCMEDPTLRMKAGPGPGQYTLSGMGELHLAIAEERLRDDFRLEVTGGRPQVSYRETVLGEGRSRCEFEKCLPGGRVLGATIEVAVKPLARGAGLEMNLDSARQRLCSEYVEALVAGLRQIAMGVAGDSYPMTDMEVEVTDVAFDENATSELAIQTAAARALEEAAALAGVQKLQPIMSLEVTCPQEQVGNVIADLMARKGRVTEMDSQALGMTRVLALVPLGEMFGYASSLRSLSGGRGEFVAEPSVYAPL